MAVVAGLVAAVSVMRAFEMKRGPGASEVLVLVIVILTSPLSTAYSVFGSMGSSQGSGQGGFAVAVLAVSAALNYLGFFLVAVINAAAVFRLIVLGNRRRRAAAQSDS
ncbi:hypothetical protein E3T27_13565 [Cryobacterium lyxosi]|uniref:Uncharacterized protein n=1 Tax=Cryobacterium lyxosi TaxID=1259228 RepID=A0A4R8Z9Y1_9MICO|nr:MULTISPECIES: hypothetical protein [unclassified Cryobacterium]TFD23833.1 hypothetical protein E3T27_13565 [Cryobacterium lyxosi]